MTLNDAKLYLRVDNDDENNLINELMKSAVSYMAGAIDGYEEKKASASPEWKAQAEQAERLLIADWYENRLPVGRPANAAVTFIITQLQL